MNPSPRRINIPTQQCSLKQCSLNSPTTPKFILSVSPVNCNLTGMQYFINPHTALGTLPTSTKISHLPTPPATRVSTSRVSHLIFRTLILPTPSSDPLHPSYQFTLAQKSPPSPSLRIPSAPPSRVLPRPPTPEPRPLARRLGQGRSLFLLPPLPRPLPSRSGAA